MNEKKEKGNLIKAPGKFLRHQGRLREIACNVSEWRLKPTPTCPAPKTCRVVCGVPVKAGSMLPNFRIVQTRQR